MKTIGIAAAALMLVVVSLGFGGAAKSEASAQVAAPTRIYPVVDPSYGFLLGGTSQGKYFHILASK